MSDTIRQINDHAILWVDPKGVTHSCEGARVHPSTLLLWTDCQRDVPANTARTAEKDDRVTCPKCLDGRIR